MTGSVGRPKKNLENVVLNQESKSDLTNELESLKKKIADLESEKKDLVIEERGDGYSDDIRLDEYIKVISLYPYGLSLSTQPKGMGKTVTFRKFGESKRILYKDLVDIMDNHVEYTNFLEEGYYYIADARIIHRHGLDEIYEKLLTKEKIEQIINGSSDSADLFKSANNTQKGFICDIMIGKMARSEPVDLNLVEILSLAASVDIKAKATEAKEYLGITNPQPVKA